VTQEGEAIVLAIRVLQDDGAELATMIPALLKAAAGSGARIGVVGGAASLFAAEGGPRVIDAGFPEEYRAEAESAPWLRRAQPGDEDRHLPPRHRRPRH
jgi:hypothetical protein